MRSGRLTARSDPVGGRQQFELPGAGARQRRQQVRRHADAAVAPGSSDADTEFRAENFAVSKTSALEFEPAIQPDSWGQRLRQDQLAGGVGVSGPWKVVPRRADSKPGAAWGRRISCCSGRVERGEGSNECRRPKQQGRARGHGIDGQNRQSADPLGAGGGAAAAGDRSGRPQPGRGGPEERRRFPRLDRVPRGTRLPGRPGGDSGDALKQRNAALKARWPQGELEAWNAEFIELGSLVDTDPAGMHWKIAAGISLEEQAAPRCWAPRCLRVSAGLEPARQEPRGGAAKLSRVERDQQLGSTQVGPHRADLA